ncbi:MAG: hypothetical protein KGH64_06120 [Candidatus Micrarchaeota archaeon]|nr:hypothetical protein [Candidatus Micrarchaeota archaeon]MDE1860068.1 hypothetical protein [Candidatus Micrarchaeota archaeon]
MTTSSAELADIKKIKGVKTLIEEIRKRRDNGHYDFMSFGGKTKLWNKLNEYEAYAQTAHSGKKLKAMEMELRALLSSTY